MPLNEADTRAKLINPGLYARGWNEDLIHREVTARPVDIIAGKGRRRRAGRIDFVLRLRINPGTAPLPIALIEAKAEDLPPAHGLEQVKAYGRALRHNVPFLCSSNGHMFVEFDRLRHITSEPKPLSHFPTPDELRARYEQAMGFELSQPAAKPLLTPYALGSQGVRYYQDAAIRAVLEKIARGEKRALLTLGTGAGKTFIAVNLLKRIADAGQLRRALFVCDRDELRTQGSAAFARTFGSDAAPVHRKADGTNNAKNARIHIATFQTLGIDSYEADGTFLDEFYPPNHFSHIIIDECHRSAWGKWSEVLKRNPDAVQVGLTATPRSLEIDPQASAEAANDAQITADNLKYFGEPAYSYDIAQGMEDGYLAACEIVKRDILLAWKTAPERDTGLQAEDLRRTTMTDAITGRPVGLEEAIQDYEAGSFERSIVLPDRVEAVCRDLFKSLIATGGPEQKTVIFSASDAHADHVAGKLNNLYFDWARLGGQRPVDPFAFKCTAKAGGRDMLPDLKGGERSHFIACTVDLLSTGVDVEWLRNVVFFRYIRSPILFYQMIGRGARIHEASGKLMFRVYDYTNATRLLGESFVIKAPAVKEPSEPAPDGTGDDGFGGGDTDGQAGDRPRIVEVRGLQVHIANAGRFVMMKRDGRDLAVPCEEYKAMLAARLLHEAPDDADAFRRIWIKRADRQALMERLMEGQLNPRILQLLASMEDFDEYDVMGEAAYRFAPRTRADRAESFTWRNEDWLEAMAERPRNVIAALAGQFALGGTAELESPQVFHTPAVQAAGGIASLRLAGEPRQVLEETKRRMFSV